MDNNYQQLPRGLTAHPYWCVWRFETRDGRGKPSKVPYNPRTGRAAKTNDRGTFAPYDVAVEAYKTGKWSGLGVLLADGLGGFDLDDCREKDGSLTARARDVIQTMDTYTEVSPSGTGVKGLFRCGGLSIDQGIYSVNKQKLGMELYTGGRFFTITGNRIRGEDVEERAGEAQSVLDAYMKRKQGKASAWTGQGEPLLTDEEVMEKARGAKNGNRFRLLWAGDGKGDYGSQSDADMALCNLLAFYTGPYGEEQLDRLFRQSGLMRDKWDRPTSGTTYGHITMQKAIGECEKFFTKKAKKVGTTRDLKDVLDGLGIRARYNVISGQGEYWGMPEQYSRSNAANVLPVLLSDHAKERGVKMSKQDITDSLAAIMDEDRYNPVEEMILGTEPDGVDRLAELEGILSLEGEQEKTYLRKWLHQCVALALNDEGEPYGADGVLVLQGVQGLGKTLFFRTISCKADFFAEGVSIDMDKKDTIIQATGVWIAELGELDSTLKREQSALKAFVTASRDTYRVPYGRAAVRMPRRTSFCATVNPELFLNDETGSRRFWVIHVDHINVEKLLGLSLEWKRQLWRQVYDRLYLPDPQGFRLTAKERDVLQQQNARYERQLPGVLEIRDQLDFEAPFMDEKGEELWKWYRVRDVMAGLELRGLTAIQVGKALARISQDDDRIKTKNLHRMMHYYLPPRIRENYFKSAPIQPDEDALVPEG